MANSIPTRRLKNGNVVPALGLGTWRLGENKSKRAQEIAALHTGIELGLTLVDTAEMYASGGAEEVVGESVAGRREQVYIVSKAYPHHATVAGLRKACEASLKRLRIDTIDLYLLHWRGAIPLEETVQGMENLRSSGKIKAFGVSNFDRVDIEELSRVPGGDLTVANQILYNLSRRGPEYDLISECSRHQIAIMAYSPLEQGRLRSQLATFCSKRGISWVQVALAWLLAGPDVLVIPKAATSEHVREIRSAVEVQLSPDDLAELNRLFPAPRKPSTLEML
ncbi:MAG: aldo/keto reductase [Verrucomicrobia bacterium]|nr:aldo/keto reductase [Verrucomicrobiota bacterium]